MRAMHVAGMGVLALMALPGVGQAETGCKPIAGAEQILKRSDLRWLVVGELHGTAELPNAFADLVCVAAARGKPVTVGLEFPQGEQAGIDAYMSSTGDASAQARLLQGPTWRQSLRDGRSSQAMLALIERLRTMKAAGLVSRVLAIRRDNPPVPGQAFDPAAGEALIGQGMREAGSADSLTLILIGNIHAALRPFANLRYAPAASGLPAIHTMTLNFSYASGSAWTCSMPTAGQALTCEGHAMSGPPQDGGPRIELGGAPDMPWSGTFYLGAAITASPPAVPVASVSEPK